ncbi:MAG: hypothetical protein GWN84_11660 [Gammaproteobacteria bacterium]|nr:hypothetical protein [Gammaproteobacteria bacterium]NIR83523.1 hypothetical protein [Gammaproteobacteria bacterium]NIR91445.1 hypothetical protein [Gammaproteobacteria bacterium]NIU04685.1 hypothetical protein [Gammaproteobacteria bacterium]NIV51727.1 hypothetical protein [Gammaproteobacteria bacterium]
MSDVMRQLHQDHHNVTRLLALLEEQFATIQQAGRADFEVMMDIMDYMTHYPDMHHHPTEDLVFERLVRRDPGARPAVQDLLDEHKVLAEKGSSLHRALSQVVDGALVPREPLEEQGRDYIDVLRRHMNKEESQVFPLAKRRLNDEDWKAVDEAKGSMQDPLFGEILDEEYRTLYQLIITQGRE